MDNIFPEDTTDPTAGTKEQEYHVERTLGVIGHVRTIAKKRKWLYLRIDPADLDGAGAVSRMREFYKLPGAPVTHQNGMWAIWSGEGEPTTDAFPDAEEDTPGLAEMVANAPPGTFDDVRTVAAQEAADRDVALNEAAGKKRLSVANETWAYTTELPPYGIVPSEICARFKARADAPVQVHPGGDIAAVWLGKGAPTRPAFPDAQPLPKANGHTVVIHPGVTQLDGTIDAPAVKPVQVSPFAPGNALNEMGLKLYGMSKETVFSEEFRSYLKRVSDSLHAEAARIELNKVRVGYDRTYGKK